MTMKRNLMICDRCGVDDFSGRASVMKFFSLALGWEGDSEQVGDKRWDLCEDCVRDLQNWMAVENTNVLKKVSGETSDATERKPR